MNRPAVWIEPCKMVPRLSGDIHRKRATHKDLAIRLDREGEDRLSAFGSNESANPVVASSRAMRIRSARRAGERTANQNLAVRLNRDRIDIIVRVRIERGVERTVRIEPGKRLRGTAAPPLGESEVKSPPTKILPSGWTTTTGIDPFAFGSKPSRGLSSDCGRGPAQHRDGKEQERCLPRSGCCPRKCCGSITVTTPKILGAWFHFPGLISKDNQTTHPGGCSGFEIGVYRGGRRDRRVSCDQLLPTSAFSAPSAVKDEAAYAAHRPLLAV